MATLERIRQRSGLLIVVIGLAMLAFILTDLLGSGNSLLRGEQNVVGKINGKSIDVNDFNRKMDERTKAIQQQNPQQAQMITRKQTADAVWDQVLQEELMGEQYDDLGFRVTSEELYERIKQNQSIRTAPAFKDPNTGAFSEALFNQYYSNLRDNKDSDPQAAEFWQQWVVFEQATLQDTRTLKYNMAVEKGLYIPKKLAATEYKMNNTQVNAQFLVVEYSTISDSTISVSDAEIKSYFNDNKEQYKAKASRDIEFVSFPVEPSEADRNELKNELIGFISSDDSTVTTFSNNDDDSLFAVSRSDLAVQLNYFKKESLPASIDSIMFANEEGYIHGPYEEGGFYYISKITERRALPDSVRARHILLSYAGANNGQSQSQRPPAEAQKLSDSLLTLVKGDTSLFSDLAIQYSDDPGSGSKGGDLGWFNERTMVKPFSDFSFENKIGDIGIVYSQFGIHLIEITNQAGEADAIEVVSIAREIFASDKTRDDIYNEASEFASSISNAEDFSTKAVEKNYAPRPVTNIAEFDENLPGIGNNREIVKWAYNEETNVNDVTLVNNDESFVVVILTNTQEEGYPEPLSIKDRIKPEVIKTKKAAQIKERFNEALANANDINALATAMSVPVKNQVANFSTGSVTGYGREPKVIGYMTSLEAGKLSKPIEGNRGVYVVQTTSNTPAADLPDYTAEQSKIQQRVRPQVAGQVFNSIKDDANIDDRRARFY